MMTHLPRETATQKIGRFARKPAAEKRAAILSTVTAALPREVRQWLLGIRSLPAQLRTARSKSRATYIRSGLGDSAELLYGLVRSMKPEVCVEIGSALGKSASYIGMALKENGRGMLYAIDPHEPTNWNDVDAIDSLKEFSRNVAAAGLGKYVSVIRSYSDAAARDWKRPIDLIFIDGDHSYEGVKRDWDLFLPHMKPSGVAIFHDTMWELPPYAGEVRSDMGVPRFVDELRERGYQVLTINRDYGVSLVQPVIGGFALRSSTRVAHAAQ